MERARSLAVELRELVEPSVVHPIVIEEDGPYTHNPAVNEVLPTTEGIRDLEFDLYGLTPDQMNSIKEIDLEGGVRRLDNLSERYHGMLEQPDLASRHSGLSDHPASGEPVGKDLGDFKRAPEEVMQKSWRRYEPGWYGQASDYVSSSSLAPTSLVLPPG